MSKPNILVLGATGAMGQYLVPELLSLGYAVDAVSLDDMPSDNPALHYIKGNVKEGNLLDSLLGRHYDGIVDFMTYGTEEFRGIYRKFLTHTGHYIFLSSCRVFSDAPPVSEKTPRLLDVSTDRDFLATEDYALYKAREEDILRASEMGNWTIVRPATTYSRGRFQLVTLEAGTLLYRMKAGKTVVLPEEAMEKDATLSWGGDVARMIARLLLRPDAMREDFIVSTAEHHTWREIAAIYHSFCPFRYVTVGTEEYLNIIGPGAAWTRYQLIYARLFRRITDNAKILGFTGMKQEELTPLAEGLRREYDRSCGLDWNRYATESRNLRMDAYLAEHGIN